MSRRETQVKPLELTEALKMCEDERGRLLGLARIHVKIDSPGRRVGSDEPDWVFRMRKVCLHAVAVTKCEVDVDGLHAMATEVRAAYVQIEAIWKCLPEEVRLEDVKAGWWANEARNGLLAAFDHPTPIRLLLSSAMGGFRNVEEPVLYLRMAGWLGSLGLGYGVALPYLSQVLSVEEDLRLRVESEVTAVFQSSADQYAPWTEKRGSSGM